MCSLLARVTYKTLKPIYDQSTHRKQKEHVFVARAGIKQKIQFYYSVFFIMSYVLVVSMCYFNNKMSYVLRTPRQDRALTRRGTGKLRGQQLQQSTRGIQSTCGRPTRRTS